MFARFTTFVTISLLSASLVVAQGGSCNAGQVAACCNHLEPRAIPPQARPLGGALADINAPNALGKVATGCTPLANLASTCKSHTVCCNQGSGSTGTLVNADVSCVDIM